MYEGAAWIVMSEEKWDREVDENKGKEDQARRKAGRKANLEKLTQTTANARCELFSIAPLMDMSFAHHWGRFGIPIAFGSGTKLMHQRLRAHRDGLFFYLFGWLILPI